MKNLILILALFVVGCSDSTQVTREVIKLDAFKDTSSSEPKTINLTKEIPRNEQGVTLIFNCKNNFSIDHLDDDKRTENNESKGLIFNKAKKEMAFGPSSFDGFVITSDPFSDINAKWIERGTQIFWNFHDDLLGGRRWQLTLDIVTGNLDYLLAADTKNVFLPVISSNYDCSKSEKLY